MKFNKKKTFLDLDTIILSVVWKSNSKHIKCWYEYLRYTLELSCSICNTRYTRISNRNIHQQFQKIWLWIHTSCVLLIRFYRTISRSYYIWCVKINSIEMVAVFLLRIGLRKLPVRNTYIFFWGFLNLEIDLMVKKILIYI